MGLYTVTFDLVGVFSGGVPQLSTLYGGVELSTDYAYASSTSVSFNIDTDAQPFDSTLLRFYFDGAFGRGGDTIKVINLQIDGTSVGGGGTTVDYGATIDVDVSSTITDTLISPPSSGAGTAATITGTGARSEERRVGKECRSRSERHSDRTNRRAN